MLKGISEITLVGDANLFPKWLPVGQLQLFIFVDRFGGPDRQEVLQLASGVQRRRQVVLKDFHVRLEFRF